MRSSLISRLTFAALMLSIFTGKIGSAQNSCGAILSSQEFRVMEAVPLSTPQVHVRPALPSDKDAFIAIWINSKVRQMENIYRSLNDISAEFNRRVFAYPGKPGPYLFLRMIVEPNSGTVIGTVSGEIEDQGGARILTFGYALLPEYWGRGIISEVIAELKTHMAAVAKVTDLVAYVFTDNLASKRALEKLGFKPSAEMRVQASIPLRIRDTVDLEVYRLHLE
jgi:RimJ/RimL family protein N-acetyltransferase